MNSRFLRNAVLGAVIVSALWAARPLSAFSQPLAESPRKEFILKQANEPRRLMAMNTGDKKVKGLREFPDNAQINWENGKEGGKIMGLKMEKRRVDISEGNIVALDYTQIEGKKVMHRWMSTNAAGYPTWQEAECKGKEKAEFFQAFKKEYPQYKKQIEALENRLRGDSKKNAQKNTGLNVVPIKTESMRGPEQRKKLVA